MSVPDKEGFYWAQWRIAEDSTPKEYDSTPWIYHWEPVQVMAHEDELKVYILGVPGNQSVENFKWGPVLTGTPVTKK